MPIKRLFWTNIRVELLDNIYEFHNCLRYGKLELFSKVEIETTSQCNRRCRYCPNSVFNRGNNLMKINVFYKIIRELKDIHYSGHIYPHFYGEPLLDKRLPHLVSYTKKNLPRSWIRIYTNGDFLTNQLFSTLIRAGVNEFYITGHSGYLPEHIKKLINTKQGKQVIRFFTIDQSKVPLFNRGGLVKPNKQILMKKCNLASNHLQIDFQGNIILCCNDYLSSIKFGNVAKEKIVDIWRKDEFRGIREETKNGIFRLDICKHCTLRIQS